MVGADPRGGVLNAFSNPDDVDRIAKGYACGYCCASFHTFQLECPICHRATNVTGQVQDSPQEWKDYVKGRGPEAPAHQRRTFDDAMVQVLEDKDVDHVTLKQLKPSRWGAGRPK